MNEDKLKDSPEEREVSESKTTQPCDHFLLKTKSTTVFSHQECPQCELFSQHPPPPPLSLALVLSSLLDLSSGTSL